MLTLRFIYLTAFLSLPQCICIFQNFYFTASQFFRCLYQTLGLNLDKNEEALLIQKYGCLERHKINYRKFCARIDQQELKIDEVPIQIPSVSQNKTWVILYLIQNLLF